MAFKGDTKTPVKPTRTRNHDPQMVKVAERLVTGELTRILATGDESKSTTASKGKQSPREQSARAEASKIAHYIRTKHPEFGEVQTSWIRPGDEDGPAVQVTKKVSENGNGDSPSA